MQTASAQAAGLDLPPDLTLLGTFFDVITDIQRTVNGEDPHSLGEAQARLSAIRNMLRHRLPGAESVPPTLMPPEDEDDPVAVLSHRLAGGELFTMLAAELSGEPISACVVRDGTTPMSRCERDWTQAHVDGSGRRPVLRRRGELRTARTRRLAANVTSLVIPSRVHDEDALRILAETDAPLGQVLAPLGLRRELLWLWPYCGTDTVLNTGARLWLPGPGDREWPAGIATEQVRRLDWWAAS
jgi:hypothetical protein